MHAREEGGGACVCVCVWGGGGGMGGGRGGDICIVIIMCASKQLHTRNLTRAGRTSEFKTGEQRTKRLEHFQVSIRFYCLLYLFQTLPESPITTTTPPAETTTTIQPIVCQNGGISNGTHCACPIQYGGLTCDRYIRGELLESR